jgi:putative transposase
MRVFSASPYYALVVFYQRRLPHWHYIGQPVFVTFRLHDSLPPNRSFPERAMTSGTAFAVFDRLLDHARSGPTFLREPAVANVIVDSIVRGADEFRHYEKHAWVVMPNHVHLLITPMTSVPKLLGLLKTATARKSNLLLVRRVSRFGRTKAMIAWCAPGTSLSGFEDISKTIQSEPDWRAHLSDMRGQALGRPVRPLRVMDPPHKCSCEVHGEKLQGEPGQ